MGFADLHIHTTYSPDGTSSISAVLKYAAHHTHLDIIAITDHDRIEGALKAQEMAPAYGIEVIPGIEISSAEGHVLALFVSKMVPSGLSLEQTVIKTIELGGLCIVPHPLIKSRIGVNPYAIRRALSNPQVAAGLVGYELFNAGISGTLKDAYAQSLLRQTPLARVGCSDAHVYWIIGQCITNFPGQSVHDLRQALINRQTKAQIFGRMSTYDFYSRYIPRLVLRYTGWVSWNKAPSEPLRLAWLGSRLRAARE